MKPATVEHERLKQAADGTHKWRRWGTYLSERQWGTVREDYSAAGNAWGYFPFEHAGLRAYRWGEDGLLGLCDNRGLLQLAPAFFNGQDPILKERLFGLSGPEGNHGEEVKELYFYVESTPTCSYAKAHYKYPQKAFPYEELRARSRDAGLMDRAPQLLDTGIFDDGRYFDIDIEYAKAGVEDILIKITATNRGPDAAPLVIVPQAWFRNTWSWDEQRTERPSLEVVKGQSPSTVLLRESHLGDRLLSIDDQEAEAVFCDNETDTVALFNSKAVSPYPKGGIARAVVDKDKSQLNPEQRGTKCGFVVRREIAPGASVRVRLRLRPPPSTDSPFDDFDDIMSARKRECDAFYQSEMPATLSADEQRVYRQAMAGLLWTKQFYHYDVHRWLAGDPAQPAPPRERQRGRNARWSHLYNSEILSMPDKWEYPWYAAWDTAFHTIPLAIIDPDFAKQQLSLLLREWYMHPNGQLPAYEWALGDVNPPVHAWATLRVYRIDKKRHGGQGDRAFLESAFHKLMLNFTWWVNRKDEDGQNVFEGGFLGLDNIGLFDRSKALPGAGRLEQADATAWMGMYCLNLLEIALELASENQSYQDVASKFFEHFLRISGAINGDGGGLWDDDDGFYYDTIRLPHKPPLALRIRSMVGLIPLFAVSTLEPEVYDLYPGFVKRMRWFMDNHPELTGGCASVHDKGVNARRLLSILTRDRLVRVLRYVLDETEFLSDFGVRSLSRAHAKQPYQVHIGGQHFSIGYEPGESQSYLFGGNSNWRGPIWWPVNYLLIESLQKLHHFYGDALRVEYPTGSGTYLNLWQVASELSRRLVRLFLPNENGDRPCFAGDARWRDDPSFRELVLFYEYFHGDHGEGLGASHQTGWTALVAKLLQQSPLWSPASAPVPSRLEL